MFVQIVYVVRYKDAVLITRCQQDLDVVLSDQVSESDVTSMNDVSGDLYCHSGVCTLCTSVSVSLVKCWHNISIDISAYRPRKSYI